MGLGNSKPRAFIQTSPPSSKKKQDLSERKAQSVTAIIGGSGPKKRETKGRCRCMSKTIGSGNFADLGSMSGNLRTRDQRPHTFMSRCPETSETQHEACEIWRTMK